MELRVFAGVVAAMAVVPLGAARAATAPPEAPPGDVSALGDQDLGDGGVTSFPAGTPTTVTSGDDAGGSDGAASGIGGLSLPNNPTNLFSTREGFNADGKPKPAFEAQLWLYLPAVNAMVGLNRPPGLDITIDRPRPTIADVVSSLSFAFTCDCTVRYGDWVGEVTVLYVATKQKTTFPPVPPILPTAVLNSKVDVLYVSPGIGYRVLRTDDVSIDARAGFTYAALNTDAEFALGEFAAAKSITPSYAQAWLGERIDYYPSPRWRIESTAEVTAIGESRNGWNAKFAVSYLFNKWVELTLGYRGSQFNYGAPIAQNGAVRAVSILLYGPMAALGVRF